MLPHEGRSLFGELLMRRGDHHLCLVGVGAGSPRALLASVRRPWATFKVASRTIPASDLVEGQRWGPSAACTRAPSSVIDRPGGAARRRRPRPGARRRLVPQPAARAHPQGRPEGAEGGRAMTPCTPRRIRFADPASPPRCARSMRRARSRSPDPIGRPGPDPFGRPLTHDLGGRRARGADLPAACVWVATFLSDARSSERAGDQKIGKRVALRDGSSNIVSVCRPS